MNALMRFLRLFRKCVVCIHDWECTGDVWKPGIPEFTCRKCGKKESTL